VPAPFPIVALGSDVKTETGPRTARAAVDISGLFDRPTRGEAATTSQELIPALELDTGPVVDLAARKALFGVVAASTSTGSPTRSTSQPSLPVFDRPSTASSLAAKPARPSSSGLALAAVPRPTKSTTSMTTPSPAAPAGPGARIAAGLLVAVQTVILVTVSIGAVVLGRGGSLDAAMAGDVAGALALPAPDPRTGLSVEAVVVKRRISNAGLPLLVITGVVAHRGTEPWQSVVVEADVDGQRARSRTRTLVDAAAVERVATAADLARLIVRDEGAGPLMPNTRAPFIVVMAAPEGVANVRLTAKPSE
jgi:hypothetical protein